jgi:hypothetical protein
MVSRSSGAADNDSAQGIAVAPDLRLHATPARLPASDIAASDSRTHLPIYASVTSAHSCHA